MAKSSYSVKPASIFGRVGESLGSALAEQVPKEIERSRLASGLQQFSEQAGSLTPMQQLAQLSSIPGITPQMVQSFGELARQQARGQALIQGTQKGKQEQLEKTSALDKFIKPKPEMQLGKEVPSITEAEPVRQTVESYIPPTDEEIMSNAAVAFRDNKELYNNDPQKAIDHQVRIAEQNRLINEAYQTRRQRQTEVQNKVESGLRNHSTGLQVQVPANVYSKIEDEAIDAVDPKKHKNPLTEQQAKKVYGDKLDTISRQYQAIKTIGDPSMLNTSAKKVKDNLRALQKDFKARDDTKNFAHELIDKNKISPSKAFYVANPVSDHRELNNAIVNLPKLPTKIIVNKDYPEGIFPDDPRYKAEKTIEVAPKIAKAMGVNGSPLAIYEELNAKGYDGETFLDYVDRHRDELKLTASQAQELGQPRNDFPTMNDWWFFTLPGLDNLLEQK